MTSRRRSRSPPPARKGGRYSPHRDTYVDSGRSSSKHARRDSPPPRERDYDREPSKSESHPQRDKDRRNNEDRDKRRRRSSRSRSPRRPTTNYDGRQRRRDSPPLPPSATAPGFRASARSRSRSLPLERPPPNHEPNFKPSGLLAAETNSVKHADGTSTVLKYNEPPEARKPEQGWRLYVFKGKEQVDVLHISRQSAYLVGRDAVVADIPTEHPSCSKQHAAIQFRQVSKRNEFGDSKVYIKPFIIDLESTNGTHVNDEQIPPSRYYELKIGDVVKFGQSTREYVVLNDEAV